MKHFLGLLLTALVTAFVGPSHLSSAGSTVPKSLPLPHVLDVRGQLKSGERFEKAMPLKAQRIYSVSIALENPSALGANDAVRVTVRDSQREVVSKTLHVGDPDVYFLMRSSADGEGQVILRGDNASFQVKVREWSAVNSSAIIETEPNNRYQDANEMRLEKTVFATADDADFMFPMGPEPSPPPLRTQYANPNAFGRNMQSDDWFRFTYNGEKPRLVYFSLDLLDREVPVDIAIYREKDGGIVEWKQGSDPVTDPHEIQALPGNKFTTRVIEKGTYYVQVKGNHPVYQLRTLTYEVPPYDEGLEIKNLHALSAASRRAVRAGMDYIIAAGDSWFANTPRAGGVTNRVANVHAETAQCIACHPAHFSTRAEEIAVRNGYPVKQRGALKFLTERLYNNPRPFYGHPGASWTRVISASANVMSRLAYLLNLHEQNFPAPDALPRNTQCLEGVAGYLKLYYKGRTELPPDETNGNTPLVSAYEIAGHSWIVFDELYRRTKKEEYRQYRDQLRRLIEQDKIKDMRDLCYQTIDFAQIDPKAYAERIRKNCERILSLQRADGQWSMLFDANSPAVEFQTGHCLWTLALAGYKPDHPQVAKAIRYLLSRQQAWGGWFDPKQSYENFRTPFRETQFAVMALSEFFKGEVRGKKGKEGERRGSKGKEGERGGSKGREGEVRGSKGKQGEARGKKGNVGEARNTLTSPSFPFFPLLSPDVLISQLDQIGDKPSEALRRDVLAAARHDEPLVRRAACEALGRVGDARAIAPLVELLGDTNKIVRHGAAWALRELASRQGLGLKEIAQALNSDNDYVRRGAVFIFAQHFSYLTRSRGSAGASPSRKGETPVEPRLLSALKQRLSDPDVFVRVYASRALWQWFYWTDDDAVRQQIVDAYLARMSVAEHPWVRRNLVEGFYSVCDENVRYLYNNWIPLLAQPEDRDKATQAHRATTTMLAKKVANALTNGNDLQREAILRGLTDFHLRKSPDRFGYGVVIDAPNNLYARIGNDIETVKFYDDAAPVLEAALLNMLDNPAHRRTAVIASYTLRDTKTVSQLPLRFLREMATEPNGGVRETMWEYFRFLPLNVTPQNKAAYASLVTEMMTGYREARLAAFNVLQRAGTALQHDPKLVDALKTYMQSDAAPSWKMQLLSALNGMTRLHDERETKLFVRSALLGDDEGALRAAAALVFSSPTLENDPLVRNTLQSLVRHADIVKRAILLEVVNRDANTLNSLQALSLVAESLQDKDATVRQRALSVVAKSKAMQQNPAIRLAVSNLLKDPHDRIAAAANALYNETDNTLSQRDVAKYLDYEFFKTRVQPLLATATGSDGKSCAHCHSTHTILRLNRPDERGNLTEEQIRDNYFSALKVVNLLEPEKSLILQKPISDATTEGILNSSKIPHGGGKRWDGPDSAAYKTVLEWIQGAKR